MKEVECNKFESKIYSVAVCPGQETLTYGVGEHNGNISVLTMNSNNRFKLKDHQLSLLKLKFSSNGKWMVSSGKDKYLNVWDGPAGPHNFRVEEKNSVFHLDISNNNDYIISGSWEKGIFYLIF
jgi:WD40 repeat protein